MTAKERIVIVGNGMAGGKLAEELVSRGRERFDITIIGEEPYGNYNRIKLVVKLKETDLPDLFLNTPQWYADNG
ncbi:MAG TPA: NAD(P)/FAD-dependent oxidoreductase, partial [Kiritimatiellia bacterium]|nr:NAD(P)/FAD-dependent oxidoreductase [Kiritimatiellia bacterium]